MTAPVAEFFSKEADGFPGKGKVEPKLEELLNPRGN